MASPFCVGSLANFDNLEKVGEGVPLSFMLNHRILFISLIFTV